MTPPIRTLAPDTAEYRRAYARGWTAGLRGAEGALERADDRNEPHAWYDGYLDAATGRDKWTWRDARLAGYTDVHDYVADQVIIAQADTDHPEADPGEPCYRVRVEREAIWASDETFARTRAGLELAMDAAVLLAHTAGKPATIYVANHPEYEGGEGPAIRTYNPVTHQWTRGGVA